MAKATDWGLTDSGFRRPTYADLLDALEHKAREQFGSQANLTVRSPLGIFLRIFAWMLNLLFSCLEDVYNSRFIDTATGSSLYNLGRSIGLQLLGAQKSVGYLTFTGKDGIVIPEGFLAETITGKQYITVQSGTIKNGSITLPSTATETGPNGNTMENTITIITNPKVGIFTVNNTLAFEGGRNTETDAEFRDRYYLSVDFAGGVNIDAIVAEIYENVSSVIAVTAEENDKDLINENGLPPHSFEIIAYGGLDEDIATAIFKRKGAGIQTFGNTTVAVISASGQTFDINFSRPSSVNIWVRISNLVTNSSFPLDGIEQIKQNLVTFIGGNSRSGLNIGQSVIVIVLISEVLKISGVVDFDIQISSDGENFSNSNIEINTRQKATTEESMVIIS